MAETKPVILVVEDELAIRQMLRFALEHSGLSVLEAGHVRAARRYLQGKLPDLILLDWMLPQITGIEFARELKKNRLTQDIPIIMLTAKATEESKVQGLDVGADDYVVKPFSPRELIARIQAVLRRGPLRQPDGTLSVGALMIDTEGQRVFSGDEELTLGPLEYRLLVFFASHQNRVFSRDELLSHVWGVSAYLDQRTVDVHVRRLRKALQGCGCHQYIQTIHGHGYRFSERVNGKK